MIGQPPKTNPEWIFLPGKGEEDLVAIGGDFSQDSLLFAYRNGWFPWFKRMGYIHWFSLDPRFIITPQSFKIPKSLKPVLNSSKFEISFNKEFELVVESCRKTPRPGQESTWILPEMVEAYGKLSKNGYALSGEASLSGKLVGGFYGVKIGSCFSGESMFSNHSNSSKAAFAKFATEFFDGGGKIIDCQMPSDLFRGFGGFEITRLEFEKMWIENLD